MSMEKKPSPYLLYAITDRRWTGRESLLQQAEEALQGGATILQMREKDPQDDAGYIDEAKDLQDLCRAYHVPFIVNDDVALAVDLQADGVHVGQHDMEAGLVREKLGPGKILGVSVQTVPEAILAEQRGADYLGVGAVFPTDSKADAEAVSRETLSAICQAVHIPVVAIGGVSEANLASLAGTGITGVALISGIFGQPRIREATARLRALCEQLFQEKA